MLVRKTASGVDDRPRTRTPLQKGARAWLVSLPHWLMMAKDREGVVSEADTALGKEGELQDLVPEAAIGHRSWTLIHLGRGDRSLG